MSVVKINAIRVPEQARAVLEQRFAERAHAVDASPGFEGFRLLRPVAGEDRYFVETTWASDADFQAWLAQRPSHEDTVITDMEVLEFEVVDLGD